MMPEAEKQVCVYISDIIIPAVSLTVIIRANEEGFYEHECKDGSFLMKACFLSLTERLCVRR